MGLRSALINLAVCGYRHPVHLINEHREPCNERGIRQHSPKAPRYQSAVCQKIAAEIFIVHRYGTGDNSFIAVDNFSNLPSSIRKPRSLIWLSILPKNSISPFSNLGKVACFICPFAIQVNKYSSCFIRQIDIASSTPRPATTSSLFYPKNPVLLIYHINSDVAVSAHRSGRLRGLPLITFIVQLIVVL